MFIGALDNPTLLGIAALVSALGGVLSTVLSHRNSAKEAKEEEEEKCHERLTAIRKESESLAEELHQLKMSQFE